MLLSPDMAAAFGDWLERERIQEALLRVRPDLRGRLTPVEDRPMLQVPRGDGSTVVVAKVADEEGTGWVVGVPHPSSPTLHEAVTLDEVVERVSENLLPRKDAEARGSD